MNSEINEMARYCHRCGQSLASGWKMSMLNTDYLCGTCIEREKKHPRYREAQEAERQEVLRGNFDYQGLLSDQEIEI